LATLQDILSGNFPAAQRYAEGYAQMPSYLQDPYLGLSTSNIGKITKGLLNKAPEVVDNAQGLLYYHGSPNAEKIIKEGFDFNKPMASGGNIYGKGLYLTNDIEHAKLYGQPLSVELKNPKLKEVPTNSLLKDLFGKDTNYGDPLLITEKYKKLGYDGIKIKNMESGAEEVTIFNQGILGNISK
jgi:hypothetical protein